MVRKLKANNSHSGESGKQNSQGTISKKQTESADLHDFFLIPILNFIHLKHCRKIPFKKVRGFKFHHLGLSH